MKWFKEELKALFKVVLLVIAAHIIAFTILGGLKEFYLK